MSDRQDPGFDRRIADWLASDPFQASPNVLEAVVSVLPTVQQRRSARPWIALRQRQPLSAPGAAAAAAVVGLGVVLAVGVLGGGSGAPPAGATFPPSPSSAPSGGGASPHPSVAATVPSTMAPPIWAPHAARGGWPGPLRPEPPSGAPDVDLLPPGGRYDLGDPRDLAEDWGRIDLIGLRVRPFYGGMQAERRGAGVEMPRAVPVEGHPDPAELWIAFGVVIDADGDGDADYRIGMDNGLGERRHREWVTDLATGETEVNDGEQGYGFSAFGTGFDTYWNGGQTFTAPTVLFYAPPSDDPGIRFYVWTSGIAAGEPAVSDFAPDEGWIYYIPPDPY